MPLSRSLTLLAIPVLLAGCATARGAGGDTARAEGGGILIEAEAIGVEHGTLLAVIQKRMSGMSLKRGRDCPEITFRGTKSIMLDANPLVYISGQRAANTCVLESLNSDDVASIEVYPNGVTRRPGYQMAPGGLILVFLKDGGTS